MPASESASFTCPRCGMTSHHPRDIEEGYCDCCHDWTGSDPAHEYLSTSCLHGHHDYCQSPQGRADSGETWAKAPGQCKFCGAACWCGCHADGQPQPEGASR